MRHVTVNTSRYITFPSWSQFVIAMHWDLKGISHEDGHKILMIVRVCIHTNQDQVKTSHFSDVMMWWSILRGKWGQQRLVHYYEEVCDMP